MPTNITPPGPAWEAWLQTVSRWAVLLGGILYGTTFFAFSIYGMIHEQWIEELAKEHFAAMIGLPCAALAALLLVTILEINTGKIEFKVIALEFKGAAGPIILWVFCFLAITAAIKALW
jgi:ethanolamine transporter EutH